MGESDKQIHDLKQRRAVNRDSRKIRLVLLAVAALAFVFVAVNFMWVAKEPGRTAVQPEDRLPAEKDAAASLSKVRHTATRDGKKVWILEAESVKVQNERDKVTVRNLKVTFFPDNGEEIVLTATNGILWPESGDMEVSGKVVAVRDAYTLETERLFYAHEKKRITAKTAVEISNDAMRVIADSLDMNLEDNMLKFMGNVKSRLKISKGL